MIAQDLTISGTVTDAKHTPLSFVNVLLYNTESESAFEGTTTDDNGTFAFGKLSSGTYTLKFSYIGFEEYLESMELSSNNNLGIIVLEESKVSLEETVVTAKAPTIKKLPGKLIFNVENTSLSTGSTLDLLKQTPGVVVIDGNIQIKFSSPTIFINGKRVYLSSSEVASLLENTDAANIKSIEVITNPSANYDAEAGTVLNIVTSRAISIGYKGSVNATYEQAIYPKYRFGTSHFYKNNWLNVYANYSYGTRKEYKEDESYVRYFQPDEVSTKSIWETDFNRTTDYENHSGNLTLDFMLDEKNMLSLSSNISATPKVAYKNNGYTLIYSPERQVDSTITTLSDVNFEKNNLTLALEYKRDLDNKGSWFSTSLNYIYYDNHQDQGVNSDYFLANNDFLRNNSFITNSRQNSNIFTGQSDIATALWGGTLQAGIKFSDIDTESILDFFNVQDGTNVFNNSLSDDFNYKENIYAEYISFEKEWEKWSITAGIRGEYTVVDAISRSLGKVNNQEYFDFFPSASFHYTINENNGIGLSYNRSIERPRYQSLNPFKYFITERDFTGGNPKLVPSIDDKITLSFDHKNKLFFEFYYQNTTNSLDALTFQNNANSTLGRVDANLIKSYQYAFDILYYNSVTSWWWTQLSTSTFYLANEFYALQSAQEKYTNDNFGQYIMTYNNFKLSKDRTFSADLTGKYISKVVIGNRFLKNQFFVNVSAKKEFCDKRATLTVGVDDIFDTLKEMASASKYYNQDNYYYANLEYRLLRVGLKYNFGNARLRDNNKQIQTDEGDRLNGGN